MVIPTYVGHKCFRRSHWLNGLFPANQKQTDREGDAKNQKKICLKYIQSPETISEFCAYYK